MTLVDHDGVIEKLSVKALTTPTHQSVRLDEGEGLETTRPTTVVPDPEHALVMPDARPPAVSGGEQGGSSVCIRETLSPRIRRR